MPVSVTLPALGESVTEGTVTRWLKQEGDTVEVDEPLLEVSTDKVDTEIPSPAAGRPARDHGRRGRDRRGRRRAGGHRRRRRARPAPPRRPRARAAEAEAPAGQQAPAARPRPLAGPAPAAEAPAAGRSAPRPPRRAPRPPPRPPQAPARHAAPDAVTLPALGESVTEGTVTRWLKQVGDDVEADEPLLEVSTDKVDTEIPSPVAGMLLEITVAEDETAEVGAELAVDRRRGCRPGRGPAPRPPRLRPSRRLLRPLRPRLPRARPPAAAPQPGPGSGPGRRPAAAGPGPALRPAPARLRPAAAPPARAAPARRLRPRADGSRRRPDYVTPLVRKLAAEHGVDLASQGHRRRWPHPQAGRHRRRRGRRRPPQQPRPPPAAAARRREGRRPRVSPLRGSTEKMTRMRKAIAKHMVKSLHVSAQLTTVVEVDVTKIAKLRPREEGRFAAREGVKLSFLPFFALAAVEALKQYPESTPRSTRRPARHLPRRRAPGHRRGHREGPDGPGHHRRR